MRLICTLLPDGQANHWETPHLLLQKFPAPAFSAVTMLRFNGHSDGDKAALMVMGMDYSYIAVEHDKGKPYISLVVCRDAPQGAAEAVVERIEAESAAIYLKVKVEEGGICNFGYSYDGITFRILPHEFVAKPGRWIGAKVGLFASSNQKSNDMGYADFDWFRIKDE